MKTGKVPFWVVMALCVLFSTGATAAMDIELVTIGNPENADCSSGFGGVDYVFSMGTTEITNAQYIEFLNAVAQTDTYSLYSTGMSGIARTGDSGSFVYSLKNGDPAWANRPVVFVNSYDVRRFANWMHNGQPTGAQDATTTEDGAYTFAGLYSVGSRNEGATYWVPSKDEWFKAAYYDPTKNGTGGYWNYATQSDTAPIPGVEANYLVGSYVDPVYFTTPVEMFDAPSYYGTYDQNGNVHEWLDTSTGNYADLHGGSWAANDESYYLSISSTSYAAGSFADNSIGFRIASSFEGTASVPEPLSIGLLLCGIAGLGFRKKKRS